MNLLKPIRFHVFNPYHINSLMVCKIKLRAKFFADFRKSVLLAFGCCSSGKNESFHWSLWPAEMNLPKKGSRFLFKKCVVVIRLVLELVVFHTCSTWNMWVFKELFLFFVDIFGGEYVSHVCFFAGEDWRLLRNVPARAICPFCVENSMKRYGNWCANESVWHKDTTTACDTNWAWRLEIKPMISELINPVSNMNSVPREIV